MRRIINATYISLDGVVEQPHEWPTIERPPDDGANTTVISGDVAGQIAALRAEPGQDIVQYGLGGSE